MKKKLKKNDYGVLQRFIGPFLALPPATPRPPPPPPPLIHPELPE